MGKEYSKAEFAMLWAKAFRGWDTDEEATPRQYSPSPRGHEIAAYRTYTVRIRPMLVELEWQRLKGIGTTGRERVRNLRKWCRDTLPGDHHIVYYGNRYALLDCVFQTREDAAFFRLSWC